MTRLHPQTPPPPPPANFAVVPPRLATSYGGTYSSLIVNGKSSCRYQVTLSARLLSGGGLPVGGRITGLALRLAAGANPDLRFPSAKAVYRTFTVWMGAATRKPSDMTRAFDNNMVASSRTLVHLARPFTLEAGAFQTGGGWYWINFSSGGYKYTGGDLVVEIVLSELVSGAPKPVPFDAYPSGPDAAAAYAPVYKATSATGPATRDVLAMLLPYTTK
ncbi:hypothetical protein HYH02_004917 [Chlamydomonas schloesseri]|uniref:Uncharacterized protein n=1 Tax=Chlamydomonas schloesseri TaxID=2026947 RepID=A0A835WMW0_9CHLO|nr:hypothetical protein HYH02_004917 [Chlamydomonas schloesseri]|eukprot:KAG2450415.1 hypothetical protein HYH02_004917 [Chlamydomonas schloesseri]